MRSFALLSTLRSEQGTSLMEMLVAMLSATIIMIAMIGFLIFTTTQTSRVSERVETDRLGRMAMARITDELHFELHRLRSQCDPGPEHDAGIAARIHRPGEPVVHQRVRVVIEWPRC